jgi:hypothetical protein
LSVPSLKTGRRKQLLPARTPAAHTLLKKTTCDFWRLVKFFLSPLPPFLLQRAPAILQSIFAKPDRTNQNAGSGIAVDCRITRSTVPWILSSELLNICFCPASTILVALLPPPPP